ncbi:FAD-binding oxidoreductase [Chloroflexota bacterium]
MGIKEDLIGIAGVNNVTDNPDRLEPYSKDYSLSRASMPSYVVEAENADEVQGVIKLANENKLPVVPCSSGIHFNGNTIPVQDGIVLDLRKMNRILDIDERNRIARIEPGVTWGQLQPELEKHDLMALNPLLPHPLKSALTSHLEREPALIPKFEYTDTLVNMEVVLPDGELLRTGSTTVPGFPDKSLADGVNPSGPGNIMWNRLLQGAQGTMGIVTWGQCKIEYRPKVNKTFFIPFKNIADTIELVYKIQRRVIGEECLLLNNLNLAAILAQKWPEDFNTLRSSLPPWTLILVLGGGKRFPEERIEYEEEALREVATELAVTDLLTSMPGLPGLERQIPDMLRGSWPKEKTYWNHAYKGSCQDLFFLTVLKEAPAFCQMIGEMVAKYDYPADDLGFYVQPMVYGGACHFQCNFYYNANNAEEVSKIKSLLSESAEAVLDRGGFFSRPYGLLADMVYNRTADYTMILKQLKKMLDPNNVMSPGRLCF